jgi:hypothetical protein
MRFRKCVGSLLLMGLLAACGGRASEGGFHPSGGQALGDGSSTAPSAGATGSAGSSGDGAPGAGAPAPKTPQSAMAAYRTYQLAYERAYKNNDPSMLNTVAIDPLLAKVVQDINGIRSQGIAWHFHNVLNPKIQGASPDGSSVVILDCVMTLGSYKFNAKTGKRLGLWRGGTATYQAIMRYSDDTWKISEATEGGKC